MTVDEMVRRIVDLRGQGIQMTLLAVCPNSDAVLEAAIKTAARNNTPMLFAATLNQVDRDGGYTGMTQASFVRRMKQLAAEHNCTAPLLPCLDHGGPWLKDAHTRDHLSLAETMAEVKLSLEASLDAGYALLHVDPTVDRTLPVGQVIQIDTVVARTVELIGHAERYRRRRQLPPISYEVGTEEVHGGLADPGVFSRFLSGLKDGLNAAGLSDVWPCFIVAKVGTDLQTTTFDPELAHLLAEQVSPLGSAIKGHYTDWVANPSEYPSSGMGGANVGPEFTATELAALEELCAHERGLVAGDNGRTGSGFQAALQSAVVASNRWQKWLTPVEEGKSFEALAPERQAWLVSTGARYVWTQSEVVSARQVLYDALRSEDFDPHVYVVDRVGENIQKYIDAFNLRDAVNRLGM